MRLLSAIDWQTFFENVSLIDSLLKKDPAEVYSKLNFVTRDRYRKVIERIAKRKKIDELEVGNTVVEFAAAAHLLDPSDERHSHIGYYLIGEGVSEVESRFAYGPRFSENIVRLILKHPTASYLGLTAFLTALIITLLVSVVAYFGAGWPLILAFGCLSLIPAANWL